MIYFFQGEITCRIKIGFTSRFIHSRLSALQTGSPDKLIFRGAHPGDKIQEVKLHERFRDAYSHGEWFNESTALTQYIAQHCVHDMDVAHSVDSLVTGGVATYDSLLRLDHKEINERYMAYLVQKLG